MRDLGRTISYVVNLHSSAKITLSDRQLADIRNLESLPYFTQPIPIDSLRSISEPLIKYASSVFGLERFNAAEQALSTCKTIVESSFGAISSDLSGDVLAALTAFDLAFTEAESEFEREELLKRIGGLGALGAFASVKMGDVAGGLALLERGRMVQLREMLRTRGAVMEELRGRNFAAYSQIMDAEQDVRWRRQELAARESASRDASVDAQSCETRDAELRKELREARSKLKDLREAAGLVPQAPVLGELLAGIPGGGAVVVPFVTEFGALAFVVPAGVTQLSEHHVVHLEGLDGRALREQLIAWLDAYQALIKSSQEAGGTRTQDFVRCEKKADAFLCNLLGWLWDKVMGPVSEKLISFGIKPAPADALIAPELVILPVGDFALLPLHAAWRTMAGGTCRTVLDDYAVTSAPSLEAFAGAKAKADRLKTAAPSLLAVIEPDALVVEVEDGIEVDKPAWPLNASREIEGPALERLFKEAGQIAPHLLIDSTATRDAFLATVARIMPSHLHFACHGGFRWDDPSASGLFLSGKDRLTVRDIITALSIHLEACRMAALSACETAMADTAAIPDELTGLVSAFLMAGAPFVEATLWSVFDATTALFMAKFYELMLKGIETEDGEPIPLSPVQANRYAVLWLRKLTHADVKRLTENYKTQAEPDCGIEPSIDMAAIFAKTKQHQAISLRQDSTIRSVIGGEINPDYLDVEPTQADPANTRLSPFHWAALTAWGY